MKTTDYTSAVVIMGREHLFKRSHKKLTCADYSLRSLEMSPERCKFKDMCNYLRSLWLTYEYGVFKEIKK